MEESRFKKGSIIRVSGKAGIGKTSLVLQICNEIMNNNTNYKLNIYDNELSISLRRIAKLFENDNYKRIRYMTNNDNIENIYRLLLESDYNLVFIDAIHLVNESDLKYINKIAEIIKNTNNILIFTSQLMLRIEGDPVCKPFIDKEIIDIDIKIESVKELPGKVAVSYDELYVICTPNKDFIFDNYDIRSILDI